MFIYESEIERTRLGREERESEDGGAIHTLLGGRIRCLPLPAIILPPALS
jgi:hypothetical protein